MAYTRKRRYSRKRKFSRKRTRKRKYRRKARIPTQLIPTKTARTLKYSKTFQLDPTALGQFPVARIFYGNSIVTCDHTFGPALDNSCMGFNMFMGDGTAQTGMYDHFVVIASKITCTFMTTGSSSTAAPVQCGITIRDGTAFTANLTTRDFMENSRTRSTVLTSAGGSRNVSTVTSKLNVGKFLGISHPLSSQELKGSFGNVPAENAFFYVWAGALDTLQDAGEVLCQVMIHYSTVFIEPKWQELNPIP